MIRLDQVTVRYGDDVLALDQVSLHIERGEFVFIVGPTGSGKSTLLKLLYRENRPSEGRVFVDGQEVDALPGRQVPHLRRGIGVVFQDFRLLPQRTVTENVAFALQVLGKDRYTIYRQAGKVLRLVGLAEKSTRYPRELSGGEQQRVSIARALVNDPPLLLADEPTGNLDPATSMEIIALLDEINRRQGTTVVVATHDQHIVDYFRRRVVELDGGRITRDDPAGSYREPVAAG